MIVDRTKWQKPRKKPDPEKTFVGHEARLRRLEVENRRLAAKVALLEQIVFDNLPDG